MEQAASEMPALICANIKFRDHVSAMVWDVITMEEKTSIYVFGKASLNAESDIRDSFDMYVHSLRAFRMWQIEMLPSDAFCYVKTMLAEIMDQNLLQNLN